MIALAGAIGTGLFLGSGRAISRSSPLGAFLGYTISEFLLTSDVYLADDLKSALLYLALCSV